MVIRISPIHTRPIAVAGSSSLRVVQRVVQRAIRRADRAVLRTLCGLAAWCLFASATASAAPGHKARISADLADHIAHGSQSIRVIVHGTKDEVDTLAARYNLRIARYMKSGAVIEANAGQLEALRDDDSVDHLSGDIRIKSSVDAATLEAIGVDQVWAGSDQVQALTGKGVTVAVIDSGIDPRHDALKRRVLAVKDFTGGDGGDRYGHGTHVAAIIAGQGGNTVDTQAYRGVAPGAYLLNVRVLGEDGSGTASDVIEAIDWTIDHREEYGVRVINLSLGAPVLQPYRDDPLCEAVERAVKAGITVVVAAGNYGRTADGTSVYGGITTPANSPYSIAVGAIDTHRTAARSDDTLAPYSSKGPTRYDLIIKPDLAAPGSHIASAEAHDSYLARTYPQNHVSGAGATAVMQLSGTSMAAGVISGAVALLVDERSDLRPSAARAVLEMTSTFLPSAGLVGAGAGSANILAATRFVDTPLSHAATHISGETAINSDIVLGAIAAGDRTGSPRLNKAGTIPRSNGDSIIWGSSILWGSSIIWGTRAGDSIIWGSQAGDSILWGSVAEDSIIWAARTGDSIIWGSQTGDSIIWGSRAGDSIIWGSQAGDSIIWGSQTGDSIIWGSQAGDSIIWGSDAADGLVSG